jgi:hypothetical protein
MTLLNEQIFAWPPVDDVERGKAMQTLWQAEAEWTAFVGITVPMPTQPQPQPDREES